MSRLARYSKVHAQLQTFSTKLLKSMHHVPLAIALTDERGYVLDIHGDLSVRKELAQCGFAAGIPLTEADMGTNAVSLSLDQQQPIQLLGADHYREALQTMASYSVPFTYAEPHAMNGALAMVTPLEHHSPYLLALLANLVESIGKELELGVKRQQLERFNSMMINTVRNGIILTDKEGRIKELNPFMEKIVCKSREQLMEQSVFELEPFGHLVEYVLQTGQEVADREIVFHDEMMQTTVCLFDALPVYDDKRKSITGAYLQFRDITDRHELERQILLSEKFSAIGKLAAGLAHEIRNPLTSVIGFVYLMKQKYKNSSEMRYLDIIDQELMTLNKLVSQFVLMAKPSNPQIRTCNLNSLIVDTVELMKSQAILKSITLETLLPQEALEVKVDAQQIKQVFVNLIQNAIEAMRNQGVIRVVLDRKADHAVIRIIDEGEGIPDEHLKQIVTPFFTTKDEGLGLGLSISYRMIESHKGKIDISSKPGVGTTFTVQLPIEGERKGVNV
ncbi:PAS domain-containing sensor histidine kinase [Xylanibacillus composti]|uniref:histidine kinase n=1 Tax=Xylanibacillus composti TaxID=1572762 RepID=A0A8J4GZI1_9BACL|nr:PAS domain-containing sensor histidine kinase [Xylanibacillus composti]